MMGPVVSHRTANGEAELLRFVKRAAGKTAVIPPRTNRPSPCEYDREPNAALHRIANFFAKIEQFRAIATRCEKTARNFLAAVQFVASIVWLN
jgi:transposase